MAEQLTNLRVFFEYFKNFFAGALPLHPGS
jgi:hypothetical protein